MCPRTARRICGFALGWLCLLGARSSAESTRVYIGTYTDKGSEGIYACDLDLAIGALNNIRVAVKAKNPSFLAFHPNRKFLYAVSEVDDFDESKGGAVSSFRIDSDSGLLKPLNSQSSKGAGPCHLSVDHKGQCVLVANYGAGSIAALPIAKDGSLQQSQTSIQHSGSSVDKQRQTAPHAHSISVSPDNRFALSADLGIDRISVTELRAAQGVFATHNLEGAKLPPGSGPRHLAFHPSGRWVYVINELANTITAFEYDAETGKLQDFQSATTLPEDFNGQNWTAEIQIHPSGKFLYGSNRGHDSIAMFAIDAKNGKLTSLGNHPTGGKTPRNFGIDPTGQWLLAANQDSDTVTVHRIDPETGKLATTEHTAKIPTPVCVKMLPLP